MAESQGPVSAEGSQEVCSVRGGQRAPSGGRPRCWQGRGRGGRAQSAVHDVSFAGLPMSGHDHKQTDYAAIARLNSVAVWSPPGGAVN